MAGVRVCDSDPLELTSIPRLFRIPAFPHSLISSFPHMQILIQVLCTKGRSIRQAIADDPRIERYGLQVTKEAQPGRAPGWLKLHAEEMRGALNVEWDAQSSVLSARVVTRGSRKPS